MSNNDIQNYLPHRYPFLLIDKIIDFKKHDYLIAQKNVSNNEPFFQGHFPGYPVFPGVLILEAMAQASGILGFATMNKTPEEGSIYYFVGADNLRFKRPVIPGDRLILESTKLSDKKGIWKFECKASVDEEFVCSATILCADRSK